MKHRDPLAELGEPEGLGVALARAFERHGDAVAAIEADRDRENARLTYRELGERSRAVAAFLAARGFRPGDRAAIALSNQWRWHAAAAAVLRLGGVLLPVDFKLSGPEQVRILAHGRPRALFAEWHLLRAMEPDEGFDRLPLDTVVATDVPEGRAIAAPAKAEAFPFAEAKADGDPPPVPRAPDDVACLVYSSGTGGRPKGCLLTHGNYLEQFRALSSLHWLGPGARYLSILPTNHAIDFMVGFLGPYFCGGTVVHLRSLRPEFVRDAFPRYRITHMALVPMILRNLETGLRRRFDELPPVRRAALEAARGTYRLLARRRPRPALARRLLRPVHDAFGGKLEALFVGGAYTDPDTIRFFHGLGIAVANGYGLTEAGTALTLDDLDPPRPDTVGVPLPGVELEIDAPGPDGVGEVLAKSATVMQGYLDEPELTAETIQEGWLRTGDLGRLVDGALQIVGRKKNMIVTAGGKNVYPEDVEVAYEGLPVKELCLFAAGYVWPGPGVGERLVLAVRRDTGSPPEARILEEVAARNRALPEYQRATGVLFVDEDFPRTASMKVKRAELARHLGDHTTPDEVRDLP